MIKVMIVDDEPIIREGIVTMTDWESLGMTVVATSGNGRDGLAKALVEKPDIVITDIRMPVADGIKFSSELRDKLPQTRIVFLTGYSDFEYSRHALRVGAADYLLKPINTEELISLMERLAGEIRREGRQMAVRSRENVLLRENLPAMRNRCMKAYMNGEMDLTEFIQRAEVLGISLGEQGYRMIICCIDYYYQLLANGERETALLKYAISNVAEELFGRIGAVSTGDEGDARLMFLVNSGEGIKEVARSAKELQFYMRKHYGISVSVGIGNLVNEPEQLMLSYRKASEALEERIKQGSSQVITREDETGEKMKPKPLLITQAEEENLKDAIQMLDRKLIYDTLEEIFRIYILGQKTGRKPAEQLCMYLILIALREAERYSLDGNQVLGKNYLYYNEISKYETAQDLEIWMKDIYSSVLRAVESRRSSKYKGIVASGIAYAREHFTEALPVAEVADAVFVTPNYFSKLFKEETGENFTEWLNKYRIEMAKQRIEQEPETKIYSIAEETGFSDYKYFAYIFKKYTGFTPTSYRNMIV